jgi:thiosulfate/3-mercaptopyruvate sulfurtransferase
MLEGKLSRKLALFAAVFMLQAVYAAAATCGGHGDRSTLLVTTSWLQDHLNDKNVVVLAVGPKAEYDKGHIPNSLFVAYSDVITKPGERPLITELPSMDVLTNVFEKLGVSGDSHVILYPITDNGLSPTTRTVLTLDAMGLGRQTSLLDGGFPAWQSEGRKVSTEVREAVRGKLQTCAQNDVITDLGYVSANLRHAGVDIVDARNPEFYTGATVPKDRRAGHIPGASNIAFDSVINDKHKLKSPAELEEMFKAAGIKKGDRVVSYCHIGQQATVIYFVARYLGYDARLFDGSWEDWSKHTELPAEVSAKP